MTCTRCGSRITAGQPCDYHERGCSGSDCRCDTTQVVHRRCCLVPGCHNLVPAVRNPRAV